MTDIASLGIRVTTQGVTEASAGLDKLTASATTAATATKTVSSATKASVASQIADYTRLDAITAKHKITLAEVGEAEAALDRLQAAGMISTAEVAAAFTALDSATIVNTKLTNENSAAQLKNAAAKGINSRTAYSISALLTDAASGQFSRSKREIAAIANETGLMAKLFSPIGIAIGVLALAFVGLGKAIYDREKEIEDFNKALGATGNFAGTTGLQLEGIAAQVGQLTGDYKDASAAVLELAKSGTVLGSSMQDMATVASNLAQLTGESVGTLVKQLISLQGDPTQAIIKTTGAMGLLTAAQYNQIVETQQQQGASAAAALAMKDLGAASDEARTKLVDNAGAVARAWADVKSTFSDLIRMISSIGATLSPAEQLANIQRQINNSATPGEKAAMSAHFQPQIAALKQQMQADAMFDNGQQLANSAKQFHDKSLAEALASKDQGDAGFVAQAAEINKKRYAALVGIVDQTTIDKINAAYDQQIREAIKRANSQLPNAGYHKPKAAPKTDPFASLNRLVQNAQIFDNGVGEPKADTAQVKAIEAIADAGAKLIKSGQDVAKVQALVATGVAALNEGYAKQAAILKGENADALKSYQQSLDKQNEALQQSIDAQAAQITMGSKQAAQMQQEAELTRRNADEVANLKVQRDKLLKKGADTSLIDAEIKATTDNLSVQVTKLHAGWKTLAEDEANGLNGIHTAIADFMAQQQNNAQIMHQFTTNLFSGFSDAFAQFASGTESAKKAFGSFIDSMYQQALRFLANKAIQSLFDSFGGGSSETPGSTAGGLSSLFSNFLNDSKTLGGSSGGISSGAEASASQAIFGDSGFSNSGASGGSWLGSLLSGLFGSANGNVFSGSGLSSYSGQIVNKPTLFPFAHGIGLMGEAGDEAILPLRRTSQGKLGVEVSGGSSGRGPVTVQQNIVVQGTVNRRTAAQIAQETAKKQRIAQARA